MIEWNGWVRGMANLDNDGRLSLPSLPFRLAMYWMQAPQIVASDQILLLFWSVKIGLNSRGRRYCLVMMVLWPRIWNGM